LSISFTQAGGTPFDIIDIQLADIPIAHRNLKPLALHHQYQSKIDSCKVDKNHKLPLYALTSMRP
jgi:hypothetical protein